MRRFDTVAVADWSATSGLSPARPSADAIWVGICRAGQVEDHYHRSRAGAEAQLATLIAGETAAGRRLLIGFDFPMGYPAGLAMRLTGQPGARAVWAWLAARITDDAENRNNRFAVAAAANRILGVPGPFWGRPAGLNLPDLPPRKLADYAALGLAERRQVERVIPRAQPVWKLYTTGAAGGQALMGLTMIHRLAQTPGVAVWPFDPPTAPVVLAEVYPSLLAGPVAACADPIRDRAQVRLLSLALWRTTDSTLLDAPVSEEGWILGAAHAALLRASCA